MNNKTNVVLGLMIVTVLTFGFDRLASASTYHYVNTSGQLSTVVANSPQEAISTAPNRTPDSGVILISDDGSFGTGGAVVQDQGLYVYYYVNTSGQLSTVVANSPQEAISVSLNRTPDSGVMLK